MNGIDFSHKQFNGITVAADWIRDLESSDSRLHKERVIEKALMAAKLGSANYSVFCSTATKHTIPTTHSM